MDSDLASTVDGGEGKSTKTGYMSVFKFEGGQSEIDERKELAERLTDENRKLFEESGLSLRHLLGPDEKVLKGSKKNRQHQGAQDAKSDPTGDGRTEDEPTEDDPAEDEESVSRVLSETDEDSSQGDPQHQPGTDAENEPTKKPALKLPSITDDNFDHHPNALGRLAGSNDEAEQKRLKWAREYYNIHRDHAPEKESSVFTKDSYLRDPPSLSRCPAELSDFMRYLEQSLGADKELSNVPKDMVEDLEKEVTEFEKMFPAAGSENSGGADSTGEQDESSEGTAKKTGPKDHALALPDTSDILPPEVRYERFKALMALELLEPQSTPPPLSAC